MVTLELQGFLFVFARVTSFFVLVPGISHRSVPNPIKIALSLVLTFMVYGTLPVTTVYPQILAFVIVLLREVIIGLSMGFAAKLVFSAVEMAGQLIDFQVGYSMGAVFDPASGATSSYYGRLFYWMSILAFFLLDLHHVLLHALMESFQSVPPGMLGFGALRLDGVLYLFSHAFRMAFSIAAPMIVVMLITDITMGIIARTVPQINVFMLGMPLKSLLGMGLFFLMASTFLGFAGGVLGQLDESVLRIYEMFR